MRLQEAKQQATMAKWQQLVHECRHSGLSISKWCKANGVGQSTYYQWQQRVWNQECQDKGLCGQDKAINNQSSIVAPPQFIQVPEAALKSDKTTNLPCMVLRSGEVMLEVYNHIDPALLYEVLQRVKNRA